MEIVNWFIDTMLLLVHAFLVFVPRLAGLTVVAAGVGAAMLWVFGRTSNQARMKQIKRRVQAGLLELRVFVDEPGVSLRAQKDAARRQPEVSRSGAASGIVDGRAARPAVDPPRVLL